MNNTLCDSTSQNLLILLFCTSILYLYKRFKVKIKLKYTKVQNRKYMWVECRNYSLVLLSELCDCKKTNLLEFTIKAFNCSQAENIYRLFDYHYNNRIH